MILILLVKYYRSEVRCGQVKCGTWDLSIVCKKPKCDISRCQNYLSRNKYLQVAVKVLRQYIAIARLQLLHREHRT
jgi:hypothetical protein